MSARSGIGFDVHPLVEGRDLVLGGMSVAFEKGLSGHSDGDVLAHAVIDALLGAAGLGDIGVHFPSGDSRFEGIASTKLLRETVGLVAAGGWQATYVDATILAERPVLGPSIPRIQASLATHLTLDRSLVNVKATTTDGLGFVGRGEGIAALCVVTLEPSE